MKVEWELTAQAFFDQLPKREQDQVARAVKKLAENWDASKGTRVKVLQHLAKNKKEQLYSLRTGNLRVLISKRQNTMVVVDVFRYGQLERIQSIQRRLKRSSG